jgi:hypothetical protein
MLIVQPIVVSVDVFFVMTKTVVLYHGCLSNSRVSHHYKFQIHVFVFSTHTVSVVNGRWFCCKHFKENCPLRYEYCLSDNKEKNNSTSNI